MEWILIATIVLLLIWCIRLEFFVEYPDHKIITRINTFPTPNETKIFLSQELFYNCYSAKDQFAFKREGPHLSIADVMDFVIKHHQLRKYHHPAHTELRHD